MLGLNVGEITLKQAIGEYREIYLAYRNFADRTRIEYVNDLEDLASFFYRTGIAKVGEITLPHLVHYLAELEKRGFAGSTRKRKVIAIRSFFSFLHLEGYIFSDLGKRLIPPHSEAREPRFLTTEEINLLLDSAKKNKRDYAIIQLLLHAGLKLSELVKLTVNDIQLLSANGKEISYIRVGGSTRNKGRDVPLHPAAAKAVEAYLSIRGKALDEMFLNRTGEQLGKRGVEKVIDKYFKMAGIKNATVNSLRHTFGTHLVEKGMNRKSIQKVMGHRDSRTTSIYFSFDNDFPKRG